MRLRFIIDSFLGRFLQAFLSYMRTIIPLRWCALLPGLTGLLVGLSSIAIPPCWAGAEPQTPGSEVVLLDPVLIEAEAETVAAADLRAAAPNSQVVTLGGDLLRFNDQSIGSALARVPGAYVEGRRGRDLSIRGVGKEYTQILFDGRHLADASRSRSFELDRVPAQFIERIELNRAPLASLPAQGVAGTVNIVMKRIPDAFSGYVSVGGGHVSSTGDIGSVGFGVGDTLKNFGYLINGSFQQRRTNEYALTENYNAAGVFTGSVETPQLRRNREFTASPRLTMFLDETSRVEYDVDYLIGRQQRAQATWTRNAAGALNGNQTTEDRARKRDTLSNRLGWVNHQADGREFLVSIEYQDGREDTDRYEERSNAAGVLNRIGTRAQRIDYDELSPRLVWRGSEGDVRWEFGAEAHRASRDEHQVRTQASSPLFVSAVTTNPSENYDIEENRLALYAQNSWRINDAHLLTTGVRLEADRREVVDGLGIKTKESRVDPNPSVNHVWTLGKGTLLKTGVARTVRRPDLGDLGTFLDTSTPGTLANPFTGGNPALKPETAWGLDVGIEHVFAAKRGLLALNAFDREIDDRIETITQLESAGFVSRPRNVGDGRLYGLEAEVRVPLTFLSLPNVIVYNHTSLLRSHYTEESTGRRFVFASQPRLISTLGLDVLQPSLNSRLGMNINRIFAYDVVAPTGGGATSRTSRENLDTIDVYYTWQVARNWQLSLNALNVLTNEGKSSLRSYTAAGVLTGSNAIREPSPTTFYSNVTYVW